MKDTYNKFPEYVCFKHVHAVKIKEITSENVIIPEGGLPTFEVDGDFITRHKPEAGGYYVIYGDGYTSYSPADAFESGYKLFVDERIEDTHE